MLRRRGILPGFGLTLGFSLLYLSIVVLVPLAALVLHAASIEPGYFVKTVTSPRALAAYRQSFGSAFAAAALNAVLGVVVAWVLVRYRFPGRKLLDALIDLPFALPTAVAGIALTSAFGPNSVVGGLLSKVGVKVAYTSLGVTLALTFVGLPFVVRTVQPVLEELDPSLEEAAAILGASPRVTFVRVIFPLLLPAILTGFALAFARGIGEYGSVVFISGNMPLRTEIVPLLIVTKLEQYDYRGATALATVMLLASFALLFFVNVLQRWTARLGR